MVVVVGGLVAGGIWLFAGDDDPAPVAAETVTSAAAEDAGAAVADQAAEGSLSGGALDTLPPGTLETLPPGTLETLPPGTLETLPRTTVTTIPPTTAAAQGESGADSCAQAADELAGVIRTLFATIEGMTLQVAGEALAAVNGFDAEVVMASAFRWRTQRNGVEKVTLVTSGWQLGGNASAEQRTIDKLRKIHELAVLIADAGPDLSPDEVVGRVGEAIRIREFDGARPDGDYDWDDFDYLVELADQAFVTDIGTWFHLETYDVVVWERPKPGAATYLFCWPGPDGPPLSRGAGGPVAAAGAAEQPGSDRLPGKGLHTSLLGWKANLRSRLRTARCL